jgi:hypothetical protein
LLADGITVAIESAVALTDTTIDAAADCLTLPRRRLPSLADAVSARSEAAERHRRLIAADADRAAVRTAECDVFGADATVTLARLEHAGRLDAVVVACMPAEVQVIRVGSLVFVAWPGEWFVEYGFAVTTRHANAFVVTLAGGDLQGYVVTDRAIADRRYEAGSAVFDGPTSAALVLGATDTLIAAVRGNP